MFRDVRILKWSLRIGAVYFAAIAMAHITRIKVPGLFIYFNVPSNAYQDQIIAFLAFGWSTFFYVASVDPVAHPQAVRAILLSGAVALLMLCGINITTDFQSLAPAIRVAPFWAQTILLSGYVLWLFILYTRAALSSERSLTDMKRVQLVTPSKGGVVD